MILRDIINIINIINIIIIIIESLGPPRKRIGGAQVTTDKHTVYLSVYCIYKYTVYRGGSRILVRGGNIEKHFIHEFLSSPVLQWRFQNFGSGEGHSAQMYSSKTFVKILKICKKNLQKNFYQTLQNFSKIKFNRI